MPQKPTATQQKKFVDEKNKGPKTGVQEHVEREEAARRRSERLKNSQPINYYPPPKPGRNHPGKEHVQTTQGYKSRTGQLDRAHN